VCGAEGWKRQAGESLATRDARRHETRGLPHWLRDRRVLQLPGGRTRAFVQGARRVSASAPARLPTSDPRKAPERARQPKAQRALTQPADTMAD
jgi:hypothetical protein